MTNAENDEFPNLQKEVLNELSSSTVQKDLSSKNIKFNSVGSFLNSEEADERMSFDQIYKLETGVPFSEQAVQKYEDALRASQIVVMVNNRVAELADKLKAFSAVPAPYEPSHLQDVINLLPQIFNSQEQIEEFLKEFGIKVNNENGIISYDYGIPNYPTTGGNTSAEVEAETQAQRKAQMVAQSLINRLNEKINQFLDGKSIEDYQNEVKSAYKQAFGYKNSVDLASKFQESQQEGVGYVKMGAGVLGAGICLLSDGTMLPVVQGIIIGTGMAVGALSGAGLSYWEATTKDGEMTAEDRAEIISELKTSGVLSLLAFGEGAVAAKIGQRLLSCSKFLSWIGEYGSMAAMGALTDYAVMGDINLSQEAISNLINIATGMIAQRKVANMRKRMQNEANNQGKVNENTNNTKPKFGIDEGEPVNKIQNINEPKINEVQKYNSSDNILDSIKAKRNCSEVDMKNLSDLIQKYPQYENEILEMVYSNNNIKFGKNLNGNFSDNIDVIINYIKENPEYKTEIVDYMKVQRRADSDTSNPAVGIQNYIDMLKKYPEEKDFIVELSKNGNLDAKSTDGGINTIESVLNLYLKRGYKKEDILFLSGQKMSVPAIRSNLIIFNKNPQLRTILLREQPEYQLIDTNPASTSRPIIEKRTKIKEELEQKYANEMNKLRKALGDDFYENVRWEDIILDSTSSKDIPSILHTINECSKFFARTSLNEKNYGKNIQWASKMNDISDAASYLIGNNNDFDSVLGFIAHEYHTFDESTTLETNHSQRNDRRRASGKYRGDDAPEGYYGTPFTKDGDYAEYFDRFTKVSGKRKSPYDDMELTQIAYGKDIDDSRGMMYHPANKYVEAGLNHVRDKYNELQPLFNKVKNGERLNGSEIKMANDTIAEIYFLMANTMPYERGSNGISDILMRSIYKNLGIDQPAIRRGVSLDLEAFCMDLDTYKQKWNSFFESN